MSLSITRVDECKCEFEDFDESERELLCVACLNLSTNCLGSSHPHRSAIPAGKLSFLSVIIYYTKYMSLDVLNHFISCSNAIYDDVILTTFSMQSTSTSY
jgi:hypothetical protein